MHDPTIAELLNRPWPSPVTPEDVRIAAQYLGVKLHNGRIPRRDALRVAYLVEHHARLVKSANPPASVTNDTDN